MLLMHCVQPLDDPPAITKQCRFLFINNKKEQEYSSCFFSFFRVSPCPVMFFICSYTQMDLDNKTQYCKKCVFIYALGYERGEQLKHCIWKYASELLRWSSNFHFFTTRQAGPKTLRLLLQRSFKYVVVLLTFC